MLPLLAILFVALTDRAAPDYDQAVLAFRGERYEESRQILEKLAALGDARAEVYNLLGWCHYRLDHAQPAVDWLQKAIASDPRNIGYHLDLINILLERAVYAAARDAAAATVRRFPESPEAWQLLGSAEFKLNNYPDAVAAYERAIRQNPSSAELRVGLAAVLWSAGRREEAAAAFERIIHEFPVHAAAFDAYGAFLAETASDETEVKRAAALLGKALALDDARFEPHYQLGALILKKDPATVSPQDLREALTHLRRAAALQPAKSKVHYALAGVLKRMGRAEEASRELEEFQRRRRQEIP